MEMEEKVKHEHYVPQTYLNLFSNNEKLYVYDKVKNEIRHNQLIRNVANKKYFYDFSEGDLEVLKSKYPFISEQYIEKELFSKDIEPKLQQTIELIKTYFTRDDDTTYLLSDELKANVAVQMAYQFLRTYGMRDQININDVRLKALAHKIILLDEEGLIFDIARFFFTKHWYIEINKTFIPIVTSDNPVAILNINTGHVGITGLREEGLKYIFYPLSSEIAVSLIDERVSSSLDKIKVDCVPMQEDFQINFLNAVQIVNANNYVFYQSEIEIDYFRNASSILCGDNEKTQKWDDEVNNILSLQFEAMEKGDFTNLDQEYIQKKLKEILEDFK